MEKFEDPIVTDVKGAKEYFNSMDYNNQRNFLWIIVDMVRAHEKETECVWDNKFPYKHVTLVDTLPNLGSKKLIRMAQKLTNMGKKSDIETLIESVHN